MADRKPLVSGNWKMNYTHLDAIAVVQKLAFSLDKHDYDRVEVSVHPPFTALRSIQTLLDVDRIPIALGAQDTHWDDAGAFTGAVSPVMLAKLHVRFVIVGHSERRQVFGETDDMVRRKLAAVLRHGMTPVLCVGEPDEVRQAGTYEQWCQDQLLAATEGLAPESVANLVVAYEPIWAIGTGQHATADDAQAMCAALRATIAGSIDGEAASRTRFLYGGSVKAANVTEFMAEPDVDGALVGGGSLDAEEMARIVKLAGV